MKRAVVATLALLIAGAAAAQEMDSPHITPVATDWAAAQASLPASAPHAETLAARNAAAAYRFPSIGNSPVPVLLPFDVDGYRQALAATTQPPPDAAAIADRFVIGGFQASKFFLAGPAGYDAAFSLRAGETPGLTDIDYRKPVHLLFSGFAMLYQLGGPALPDGELVKDLQDTFPGIRRYFYESYVRYVFERYGVTYVASIYCQDRPPRARYLTCLQADRIIKRFLGALRLVGGTPAPPRQAVAAAPIERPVPVSPTFTYFSPGFLIPGSGYKPDLGGRADYTVYGNLRFPLAKAPDFANSQSFNNWGDCDFTGRSPRHLGKKGMAYACKVNGRLLVFDESAGANYSYPWRDNFCEHRHFYVGQCPGGEGHQGQDIRPSSCTMLNHGADRCQPYQHDVVAVHDGMVLRPAKTEALLLFINTLSSHLRVRYMHMSPKRLDEADMLSGTVVHRDQIIGTVGNFNDFAGGTTYHLHFDLQVPTRVGWVLVNPYMTLVSAYERLIGGRGTEIRPDDPVPAENPVPPVIGLPTPVAKALPTEEHAASTTEPRTAVELPKPKPAAIKSAHEIRIAVEMPQAKPAKIAKPKKATKGSAKRHKAEKRHKARKARKRRHSVRKRHSRRHR